MSEQFRVLLIEDSLTDAKLIQAMLSRSADGLFDLEWESRLGVGRERVAEETFDLVLLDLSLPDSHGIDTFSDLNRAAAQIPIIVLTGFNDKALAVDAVRLGAQDYIVKGQVSGELLSRSMRYAIERKQVEEQLRARTAQLEALRELSLEIAGQLDLDELLRSIALRAVELAGADAGAIGIYVPKRDAMEFSVCVGEGRLPCDRVAFGGEVLARKVLESVEPVIVSGDSLRGEGADEGDSGAASATILGVPIRWADNPLGVLEVAAAPPHEFTDADARLLSSFASQAAIAIENAELHQAVRNRAQALEREVNKRTSELRTEHARVRAILESITDGIVVTTAQGEVIDSNDVADNWLNHSLSPDDTETLSRTIREMALDVGDRPERLLELSGLDLQMQATPLQETPSGESEVVIAIHDVSHLKALDRMKSRFISNLSHELRTPLTTMRVCLELMERRPEQWHHYVQLLDDEVDHQVRLVEQILELSNLDAGRVAIHPRPVDLNNLIDESIAMYRKIAERQGIELVYAPAPNRILGMVDQQRIMQVLDNLLRNALQFTPEGGLISISTDQEEMEGRSWAVLTVADTGYGIPDHEIPHIFERFFRGEKPRLMQVSGTGLGLAIVQEIVALHGGWVQVDSRVGLGSAFTVWVPADGVTDGIKEESRIYEHLQLNE